MSNSIYATLSRQDGLLKELQVVANNIANTNTAGYKTDRAIFAEYLMATGADSASLSMGGLAGHSFDLTQGTVKFTGGQFDLALQGEGFFALETDAGPRLTRAGACSPEPWPPPRPGLQPRQASRHSSAARCCRR